MAYPPAEDKEEQAPGVIVRVFSERERELIRNNMGEPTYQAIRGRLDNGDYSQVLSRIRRRIQSAKRGGNMAVADKMQGVADTLDEYIQSLQGGSGKQTTTSLEEQILNEYGHIPQLPLGPDEDSPTVCEYYTKKASEPCDVPSRCWGSQPAFNKFGIDAFPPDCGSGNGDQDTNGNGTQNEDNNMPIGRDPRPGGLGDVSGDGKVTAGDASLARQIATGSKTPVNGEAERADVDGDGNVTSHDADLIQEYVAHSINEFPAESSGGNGNGAGGDTGDEGGLLDDLLSPLLGGGGGNGSEDGSGESGLLKGVALGAIVWLIYQNL